MTTPYYTDPQVTLYHDRCEQVLPLLPPDSVDLVLTSPPYDRLRLYNGHAEFDFPVVARELFRVVKPGGVVVWVVGDASIDGSETGSSFRQALTFKELGFRLHDTMIYMKHQSVFTESTRYNQQFEYMFVLSKGAPQVVHLQRVPTKPEYWGRTSKTNSYRQDNGVTTKAAYAIGHPTKIRGNVWVYHAGYMHSAKDPALFAHPALMPEALALDHIASWSDPEMVVFDPFAGAGTTLWAAKQLGRQGIGIEVSEAYCALMVKRLAQEVLPLFGGQEVRYAV